jgi:hypothetical protein
MLNHIEKIKVLPEVLVKLHYNFDFEYNLKAKCDKTIEYSKNREEKVPLEYGDAVSTVIHNTNGEPHTWVENKKFIQFLNANMPYILEQFGLARQPIGVSNSWVNRHSRGGETLEHMHQFVDLVVSSYLFCPEGSGNLLVRDPLEYHRWHDVIENSFFTQEKHRHPWIEVPVKTNDVLIFPGWLLHKTEKSNSDIDRYVMTINLKYGPGGPRMSPGMT